MGYLKISNLYKETDILLFKRCYALEKIDGTSAHISWKDGKLSFYSGGASHEAFVGLFDQEKLKENLRDFEDITIYGEAYGGKVQGMSKRYGTNLKFIVFDIMIHHLWLNVPAAHGIAQNLGFEFVDYEEIPADLEHMDLCRDKDSTQAIRNGMGEGHRREGVVLRPLVELRKNDGERVITKHKREEERETKTPREIGEDKLKILTGAQAIADEWVTDNRLDHVLNKIHDKSISNTGNIIKAMIEDVKLESVGEVVWSKDVEKAISKNTALLFKRFLQRNVREN